MTLRVSVHTADTVTVHRSPSWLARLFGRRERTSIARRDGRFWHYLRTGREVDLRTHSAIVAAWTARERAALQQEQRIARLKRLADQKRGVYPT